MNTNSKSDPSKKPIVGAVIAASGLVASGLATAGTYTTTLSGAITEELTSVMGVPGVSSAPNPPLYQVPRLVTPTFGPGWATEMEIEIDSQTGNVVGFEEVTTEGRSSGSGGPQGSVNGQGLTWTPGVNFATQPCTNTVPATGTIVYDCPTTINVDGFSTAQGAGFSCLTPQPSSTNFSGANGCGNNNTGVNFPGGNPPLNPVFVASAPTANGAYVAVPANSSFGIAGPTNPAFYATVDRTERYNGIDVRNTQVSRAGGTFTIKHSGSFAGGDFAVTDVDYYARGNANFPVGPLPPGEFVTFNRSQYSTVLSSSFTPSVDDLGKNVPAMGAFGLAALFGGLIAIAGRLRRRVS